jgi:hypothetical protein
MKEEPEPSAEVSGSEKEEQPAGFSVWPIVTVVIILAVALAAIVFKKCSRPKVEGDTVRNSNERRED